MASMPRYSTLRVHTPTRWSRVNYSKSWAGAEPLHWLAAPRNVLLALGGYSESPPIIYFLFPGLGLWERPHVRPPHSATFTIRVKRAARRG